MCVRIYKLLVYVYVLIAYEFLKYKEMSWLSKIYSRTMYVVDLPGTNLGSQYKTTKGLSFSV
jgi:hypothetical protein